MRIANDCKGLIRMAPRMAPNTRIRLIPLLLLCMSGASFADGLPALRVSPDLLRGSKPVVAQPAVAAPGPAVQPVPVETRVLDDAAAAAEAVVPEASSNADAASVAGTPASAAAGNAPAGHEASASDAAPGAPLAPGSTEVRALRMQGTRGVELVAEGKAELRRDDMRLNADKLTYHELTDEVVAEGDVVIDRGGDVIRGPRANLVVGDRVGAVETPRYELSRTRAAEQPGDAPKTVSGSGTADVLRLEGENQYRLDNATWTTCSPSDPDWYIKARELELDYDREVGTARGGSIVFLDTPIFWMPWAEFPLTARRQSGLLPPTFGSSNKTGVDFTQPYYWNIAPNYDATIAPRFMSRRGVQVGGEVRYLGADYRGTTRVEWMPEDRVTGEERRLGSIQHQHRFSPNFFGTLDLNAVSDDEYFEDLSSSIGVASRVNLLRQAQLIYSGGWWTASALAQRYQTLSPEGERPNTEPYRRLPQLKLDAARADLPWGLNAALESEFVRFEHRDGGESRDEANRFIAYPQLSLPLQGAAWFVTPKAGVHYSRYDIDRKRVDLQKQDSITRTVPIASLDSGLFFERETNFFGGDYLQTLEPRLYYLRVAGREQQDIPIFDSSRYDVGFAQIFSENRFSGSDRIGDANDLTAAVTTRFIEPDTGVERLRALIGQRYYFSDQEVFLRRQDELRRAGRGAEILAGLGGQINKRVSVDSYVQYNTETSRTERLNANVRYRDGFARVLNLSYRYAPNLIIDGADGIIGLEDIDVSGQWPLARRWYGVGRVTHSLKDDRVTEAIAGLEYDGGCWVFRTALHRFAIDEDDVTNAVFIQLELNDLAGIGSNPLNLIRRSVPGYGKINDSSADRVFGSE